MSAGKIYIFVDLDGVLSDFDRHATAHDMYDDNGRPKYDILTREWWASMPVFDGAEAFFESLHDYGEVRFLSGPTLSSDSYAGKAEWVQDRFQPQRGQRSLKKLIICYSGDKHLMAGPGRILIDDRESNIKDWEQAGGIGILHAGDFEQTLQTLIQKVKKQNGPSANPSSP